MGTRRGDDAACAVHRPSIWFSCFFFFSGGLNYGRSGVGGPKRSVLWGGWPAPPGEKEEPCEPDARAWHGVRVPAASSQLPLVAFAGTPHLQPPRAEPRRAPPRRVCNSVLQWKRLHHASLYLRLYNSLLCRSVYARVACLRVVVVVFLPTRGGCACVVQRRVVSKRFVSARLGCDNAWLQRSVDASASCVAR
jgi:hypothetical protein